MIWRIQNRKVFADLRTRGLRVRSGPVRMTFLPLASSHPQVAMAIGRRVGDAVERNRGRRRIRAAFRQAWAPERAPTGAYLITGGRSVLTVSFAALVAAVEGCLDEVASRTAFEGSRP